jgi:K+-transporting ATPase KdpF subunit
MIATASAADNWIALAISVALAVYLLAVLIAPEKF